MLPHKFKFSSKADIDQSNKNRDFLSLQSGGLRPTTRLQADQGWVGGCMGGPNSSFSAQCAPRTQSGYIVVCRDDNGAAQCAIGGRWCAIAEWSR